MVFFISVATHCVDVKTFCPKLPSPKLLLYFWMKFENFFCRDAFYRLDYPCWTQHRYALYQKMYMILISSNLYKSNFISLRDFKANVFQTHIHSGTKYYSPVYGNKKVLIEGAQYKSVWLETQPMGGYMYAKRKRTILAR